MLGLALVLAIVAVFVAVRWINQRASGNTAKVAVAIVDVSLGSRLTPEMVRLVDWPTGALPPGAFSDPKRSRSTASVRQPATDIAGSSVTST